MHRKFATLALAPAVAVLVLAGGSAPLGAQAATINIAVVDLDLVVARSAAGKALQARLEAFEQEVRGEVDRLNQEAQAIRQRVAEGAQSLSEEQLGELQKDYEDKLLALRRLRDDKQREGQKIRDESLRQIEKDLEPIFAQVRDEGAYDLILNNVPGVVVMAGPRVDISELILQRFDAAQ